MVLGVGGSSPLTHPKPEKALVTNPDQGLDRYGTHSPTECPIPGATGGTAVRAARSRIEDLDSTLTGAGFASASVAGVTASKMQPEENREGAAEPKKGRGGQEKPPEFSSRHR